MWLGALRTVAGESLFACPATKEKGEKLMSVLVERLGSFLVELAQTEMDEEFPY